MSYKLEGPARFVVALKLDNVIIYVSSSKNIK